jgi:phage tail sheath gpL-like
VPLFYAELDNSQANTATVQQRVLLIGQILAAGVATPNMPLLSAGVTDAQLQGGVNSNLALMTAAYRANDPFSELWYLPLSDAAGAAAASGTVTFTASATANGVLSLYVGDVRYQLPVTTTQTPAQLAAALAALINADPACPVTAAAALGVVTLTADNKGTIGNEIGLTLNYQGTAGGEATPTGLGVTLVPLSGGTINPTLTTALSNLGNMPFDFILCPYTDTTSLQAIQAFLNDQAGRWSPLQQLYGHVFAAFRGTAAACTTFGAGFNDQHTSVLGFYGSPTPAWKVAAQWVAAMAPALQNDPGRPVQSLPIGGMLAPRPSDEFLLTTRNTLLWDGISTFSVGSDGTCRCENTITTYQKNAYGAPDDSYLEVETMFLLAFVLRFMKGEVTSKYGRMKLAANGTRFAKGAPVVTPNIVRGGVIASYQDLEFQGYVQNSQAFAQALIVEQNAQNPNRLDVLWPGTLIDQLRIFALLAQFRLR